MISCEHDDIARCAVISKQRLDCGILAKLVKMEYELYIFDLDGTILDTVQDLAISVNYALAVFDFPPLSVNEIADRTGNGVRRLVELSVPKDTDQKTTLAVLDVFKQHYFYHCADHTQPYEGIIELLKSLRAAGKKCAVVSNKMDSAVQELVKDYFNNLFDVVVGQRDDVRAKPYPDSVNKVMDALGVDRAHTVYVGDSEVDVQTALNAHLDCIAVSWGFRGRQRLEECGAKTIVDSPGEIVAYGNSDMHALRA